LTPWIPTTRTTVVVARDTPRGSTRARAPWVCVRAGTEYIAALDDPTNTSVYDELQTTDRRYLAQVTMALLTTGTVADQR
jgi:hypothetical protein